MLPVFVELRLRGIADLSFVIINNQKFTSPHRHVARLRELSALFSFHAVDKTERIFDVAMYVEGSGIGSVNARSHITMTFMTDFSVLYGGYINRVNAVIMPGVFLPRLFGTMSEKNLYLGSPKYDCSLDKAEILKRYNLADARKIALVVAPKHRDTAKIDISAVHSSLRDAGYTIVVKAREKDRVLEPSLAGDLYIEDDRWFPHPTLEFIECADVVVTFGSSCIKESIMLGRPTLNFPVKENHSLMRFFESKACSSVSPSVAGSAGELCDRLIESAHTIPFSTIREEFLFEPGASRRIVDSLINGYL